MLERMEGRRCKGGKLACAYPGTDGIRNDVDGEVGHFECCSAIRICSLASFLDGAAVVGTGSLSLRLLVLYDIRLPDGLRTGRVWRCGGTPTGQCIHRNRTKCHGFMSTLNNGASRSSARDHENRQKN